MNPPSPFSDRRRGALRFAVLRRVVRWLAPYCAPLVLWAQALPGGTPAGERILLKPLAGADLTALHAALGARVLRRFPAIDGLEVVALPPGADVSDLVAAYQSSGLVQYAEPDTTLRLLAEPNDFRYGDGTLWGLRNTGIYGGVAGADIDAARAWDIRTGAGGVVVAVVDTGVRLSHEDLRANLWTNPGESGRNALGLDRAANALDDDGNGYVDDVHGINAILGTGLPLDDHGHGTHVAGVAGGVGNNAVGVTGVAWRVPIMSCKFLDSTGHGAVSDAITCLDYARANGARVVNASWGDYTTFASAALRDAIGSLGRAGVLLVAAAGNDGSDNDTRPLYPASYALDNIIAVAATDRTDRRAAFSNFGKTTVHLGAPGAAIFSAWNGADHDYRYLDGTSMAAPHVAAACALVAAQFPGDDHRQVRDRVLAAATPLPDLAGRTSTGGRLNLFAALTGAAPAGRPSVAVAATDAAASESGPDPGTFTVSRTGDVAAELTVRYALGGPAGNGTDYDALPGSVTIPAGAGEATVTVRPINDAQREGPEQVVLTLLPAAAYAVGAPAEAAVGIADNDGAPVPWPLPL